MTTGSSVSFAVAAARIKEPVAFLAKARDGVLLTACDDRNRGIWWAAGALSTHVSRHALVFRTGMRPAPVSNHRTGRVEIRAGLSNLRKRTVEWRNSRAAGLAAGVSAMA